MARNTKALILVWASAALYMWALLRLRWIPHDDGALGQAADWINQGLLPHRDFIDVYTGGLSMLHGLAFRLLGPSLLTLRLVLFAAFLLWVPAVFYIATRLAGTVAAALITLLAVVWSVPNYPASMPSWYNLFFATFGVAALFRHMEDPRARWLVLAGACGGLSFLMKVAGLYYVAGVLLYLVYRTRAASPGENRPGTPYSVFVTACLAVFVVTVVLLIRRVFYPGEVLQFVVPSAAVGAFLVYDEWTHRSDGSAHRFRRLFSEILPFVAGVIVPIGLFLIPYVASSSVGAFFNGVFLLPMRRFQFAYMSAPAVSTLWALLPIVAWAVIARSVPRHLQYGAALSLAVVLALLVLVSGNGDVFRAVWYAARMSVPALTVVGAFILARRRTQEETMPRLREGTVLLLCVTAVCTLVQFPFASTIYFCYIAPLVALTALAFLGHADPIHRHAASALGAFLIAFAVLRTNGTDLRFFGAEYHPQEAMRVLQMDRGGIAMPVVHAEVYERLTTRLREQSKNGYTWASPDAPEIYFLSGLASIERAPYEFFDDMNPDRILKSIDAHGISAVVVQTMPMFSPPITDSLYHQLAKRFPLGQRFGPFILMWHK